MIRSAKSTDVKSIATIYNYYINNSIATFEEEPITIDDMTKRINKTLSQDLLWLVEEDDNNKILGYIYASKWKDRCAYL